MVIMKMKTKDGVFVDGMMKEESSWRGKIFLMMLSACR